MDEQLSLADVADASSSTRREARVCAWCRRVSIDTDGPAWQRFCSKRCRQAEWRARVALGRAERAEAPIRVAYADPPYPGLAARYYGDHPDFAGEVDHRALVARLDTAYPDGWALSTSAAALQSVLAVCPARVRVAVWVRNMPNSHARGPRSSWEAVVYAGGRPYLEGGAPRDVCTAGLARAYPGRIVGTKPPAFCGWLFALLGLRAGDTLHDLFPGSGAVAHSWALFQGSAGAAVSCLSASDATGSRPAGASLEA